MSSSPETVTEGPAMTFTEFWDTVIVGALVSWVGVGGSGSTGVTGVGGVGSTGSSPPQETRNESARNQESITVGIKISRCIYYFTCTLMDISGMKRACLSMTRTVTVLLPETPNFRARSGL